MKTIYFEKDIPRILATKFAARFFRPLLFTGLNAVKYNKKLPNAPLPGPDWVRVKNTACGVCGTDVSFFQATTGTSSAFEPIPGSARTYMGHENVGVVVETGPGGKRHWTLFRRSCRRRSLRFWSAICQTDSHSRLLESF